MPTAEELAQSQSPQSQPSNEPATDEAKLGNIVNAAVTAHLKRANLSKTIADAVAEALRPVQEQLATARSQPAPEPHKPSDPKATPEFAAATRQLEEFKAKFEAAEAARAAAEKRQREDRAFSDLRSTLQTAGVKADMVDVAAKVLFHADNRISFDENGNALFRHTKNVPGYGEEDEILPLSAGVHAYVKSPAAAPFLPAPTANQSPNIPARRPSGGHAPTSHALPGENASESEKVQSSMAREAALRAQFGDG